MAIDFSIPREVKHGGDIPRVHPHDTIPLLKTNKLSPQVLEDLGARKGKSGWFVKATEDLDLDLLKPILPRFAHRVVVPEVPDLIPQSSWHSSLANLLTKTSWDDLAAPFFERWGGCEECGIKAHIECHEKWEYEEPTGMQFLVGLRSLCRDCHMTQHLGLAGEQGRLDRVIGRAGMINRLYEDELQEFYDQSMARWRHRSGRRWTLGLEGIADRVLRLKGNVIQTDDNTVQADRAGKIIQTRIVGMRIENDPDGKRLRLVAP